MTDRVSSIESSSYESEEYDDDDHSRSPSPKQLQMAMDELQSHNISELKQIGEGAFGYVFKGKFQGSYAVIKVSLHEHTKNILKYTPKIQQLLLSNLQRRTERKSNAQLRFEKNEQQFFTEDHVLRSEQHPELVYHIMEFLPGKDLQVFLEDNAKKDANDNTRLTYTDLMKIFCSLLHAMKFFHEAGMIFDDLKLENVLVDPKYKRVVIIDYIDSSTGCSKLKCQSDEDSHIVNTFVERHADTPSIAEDIWRIALTILDAIHLLTTGSMSNMPANDIQDMITRDAYPLNEIRNIVNNEIHAMQAMFHLTDSLCKEFSETLLDMLDENPSHRPSVDELFEYSPFNTCIQQRQYLMPKMLKSRRLAKQIARRLGEEMGEQIAHVQPSVVREPSASAKASKKNPLKKRKTVRSPPPKKKKRNTTVRSRKTKPKKRNIRSTKNH